MTTSKAAFRCPHCNGPMHTRTSRAVSRYLRQGFLACIDPECGATYGIDHEITHQIRPSGKPDPLVAIRTSPPRKAPLHPSVPILPANDDGDLGLTGLAGPVPILSGFAGAGGSEVPPPANDAWIPAASGNPLTADGPTWIGYDPGDSANDAAAIGDAANS